MNPLSEAKNMVIDGSDLILGRLASVVAKRLLEGEGITVVNAEKIVISKSKKAAVKEFKAALSVRTLGSQLKAPKRPRTPENVVRRTVRGMLPWKKPKGKLAYKRLRVHRGIPDELRNAGFQVVTEAMPIGQERAFMSIEEYTKILG